MRIQVLESKIAIETDRLSMKMMDVRQQKFSPLHTT